MRVLIAFDKFKDAIDARTAGETAAAALRERYPSWAIDLCPLTDGGDGFAHVLSESVGVPLQCASVTGPRQTLVEAHFGLIPAQRIPAAAQARLQAPKGIVAVIEMAQASGLASVPPGERDPWTATSLGTGELMRRAAEAGASVILLGVGGSATHDLGLGAASALGFSFYDSADRVLAPFRPAEWERLARIEGSAFASLPPVFVACDVDNPLFGPRGAAAVYGPQKGLHPEDLPRMETQGRSVAAQWCDHCGQPRELIETPGSGAAGGIAFGLMAGLNAQLLAGFELVTDWLDLDRRMAAADLVITGEGRFDESSLAGKGPGAIAARALAAGKPVHVFAGQITPTDRPGLHLHAITPATIPLAQALRETREHLRAAVVATF